MDFKDKFQFVTNFQSFAKILTNFEILTNFNPSLKFVANDKRLWLVGLNKRTLMDRLIFRKVKSILLYHLDNSNLGFNKNCYFKNKIIILKKVIYYFGYRKIIIDSIWHLKN